MATVTAVAAHANLSGTWTTGNGQWTVADRAKCTGKNAPCGARFTHVFDTEAGKQTATLSGEVAHTGYSDEADTFFIDARHPGPMKFNARCELRDLYIVGTGVVANGKTLNFEACRYGGRQVCSGDACPPGTVCSTLVDWSCEGTWRKK